MYVVDVGVWRLVLYALFPLTIVLADVFEECANETGSTFIVSPKGCSYYIYCDGLNSYEDTCGDGLYFNVIFKTCDPQDMVDCTDDTTVASTLLTTPTTGMQPVTQISTSDAFTATLSQFTTAAPQTSLQTAAPAPTTSSTSTATPFTVLPSSVYPKKCPTLDDVNRIVYMPHPNSCSDYFVCYHGQMMTLHCSAMLHFNFLTHKCDYPERAMCKADLSKPKEQCQTHTIDYFPYVKNCNYFYYCKLGHLMLQQCPFGFGWDYEKRACVTVALAKCYNQQNRL